MSDRCTEAPHEGPVDSEVSSEERQLEKLREVIVGSHRAELEHLKGQLADPKLHAEHISRDLPEAIVLRTSRDDMLAKALMPTMEDALKASVRRQPMILVDAISPLMGPAIRRSIANTFREMMQSFNKTLAHSFSLRGLRWRLEALRAGKQFAEVVLLHTLKYRVEQVFLIHKDTGLLLLHVAAGSTVIKDSDMVSGMLTAIQSFVQDSFEAKAGDTLETMQVGGLNVWIQESPDTVLAAVIRGEAPQQLRSLLRDTVESIHLELSTELASWDGDTAPFERARPYLEECLVEVVSDGEKGRVSPLPFILIAAIVVAALGAWVGFHVRNSHRWEACLQRLNAEPGILVTSSGERSGKYFISGLRDPLSEDPIVILNKSDIDAEEVETEWRHYQALAPQFILKRAKSLLRLPGTVSLSLKGGTLYASGSAPHGWILRARDIAWAIAGVDDYQDEKLRDLDLPKLETAKLRVEGAVILFSFGTAEYVPEQSRTLETLFQDLTELFEMARMFDKNVSIRIVGHTDKSGPENLNVELSQQRADRVLSDLVLRGFRTAGDLQPVGMGFSCPLHEETTEADKEFNRSVSFEVTLKDKAAGVAGR